MSLIPCKKIKQKISSIIQLSYNGYTTTSPASSKKTKEHTNTPTPQQNFHPLSEYQWEQVIFTLITTPLLTRANPTYTTSTWFEQNYITPPQHPWTNTTLSKSNYSLSPKWHTHQQSLLHMNYRLLLQGIQIQHIHWLSTLWICLLNLAFLLVFRPKAVILYNDLFLKWQKRTKGFG